MTTRLDIRLESPTEEDIRSARRSRMHAPKRTIHFRLMRDDRVVESFIYVGTRPPNVPRVVEQLLPFLVRVSNDEWHDRRTEQLLSSFEDVVRIYGSELPEDFRIGETPQWLGTHPKGHTCSLH